MTTLHLALDYASRRWPVFPLHTWTGDQCSCGRPDCSSPAKHPRTKNGLNNATCDPTQITEWWNKWPDSNIGIRTGDTFDVLDVDGEQGWQSLTAYLEHHGDLPGGPVAITGGGGWHFLFQPTGQGNRAGLLPKVDWRGKGGYIVAVGSTHRTGQPYEWADQAGPDQPLPAAPDWLHAILTPPTPTRTQTTPAARAVNAAGDTAYGIRALEAEIEELARAAVGTRNHSLNVAAFNLFQLAAGGELDEQTVWRALINTAVGIGLTETEARNTIASGRKGGYAHPRSAPELRVLGANALQPHINEEPPPPPPPDDNQPAPPPPPLEIIDAAELIRRVRSRPPTGWLIQPIWPADAYGVLAAEQKAGKTWANLDLVVSVASGTPWMGIYPVQRQGQVLVFLGEGGERKMLRRLEAVCAAKGVELQNLPIRLCFRVPHLTSGDHIERLRMELEQHPPVLVVVDPLYLAARGAKGSQLYEMGEHLETIQQVAQAHDAALLIVHHWNKTGEGKGAKRMTGVGPGEWGRVLISVSIRSKHTDKTTRATQAVLDWEFEGDEIPELEIRTVRKVWADDPDNLDSPMHYDVQQVDMDDVGNDDPDGYSPSTRRVAGILTDEWQTVQEIGDKLAEEGRPLKKRTIQAALKQLAEDGHAQPFGHAGDAYRWRLRPHWGTNGSE